MSTRSALFSFLAESTAPDDPNERSELIVFIREIGTDRAKAAFQKALAEAGRTFPEVKEIAEVSGDMQLSKLNPLNLENSIRAAARNGAAIVIFNNDSK
jgi:hypothetical protein